MRRGMESISLWHCSGVMRAQVAMIVYSITSWYTAVLTLDLRKHSGPTPADDMAAQTITDCGNFTLDLKQRGFCASPLFLQTLGHWFPKEMQNLLSSENITLDHSAAVQSFLSLAQARRFWRCLLFKSGLTQGMRQLKPMSCIRLCVVVLGPAAVHSLWSPHIFEWVLFHNPLQGAVIPIACTLFSTTSFPPFASLLMCLGHSSVNSQPLLQWPFVSCPPCARCQWSSFGQLSSQQSSPWLCSLQN